MKREKAVHCAHRLISNMRKMGIKIPRDDLMYDNGLYWYSATDDRITNMRRLAVTVQFAMFDEHGEEIYHLLEKHGVELYVDDNCRVGTMTMGDRAISFHVMRPVRGTNVIKYC